MEDAAPSPEKHSSELVLSKTRIEIKQNQQCKDRSKESLPIIIQRPNDFIPAKVQCKESDQSLVCKERNKESPTNLKKRPSRLTLAKEHIEIQCQQCIKLLPNIIEGLSNPFIVEDSHSNTESEQSLEYRNKKAELPPNTTEGPRKVELIHISHTESKKNEDVIHEGQPNLIKSPSDQCFTKLHCNENEPNLVCKDKDDKNEASPPILKKCLSGVFLYIVPKMEQSPECKNGSQKSSSDHVVDPSVVVSCVENVQDQECANMDNELHIKCCSPEPITLTLKEAFDAEDISMFTNRPHRVQTVIEENVDGVIARYLLPKKCYNLRDWIKRGASVYVTFGHSFLEDSTNDQLFCSACFRRLNVDRAFACRDCRYICHKECLEAIEVACHVGSIYWMDMNFPTTAETCRRKSFFQSIFDF